MRGLCFSSSLFFLSLSLSLSLFFWGGCAFMKVLLLLNGHLGPRRRDPFTQSTYDRAQVVLEQLDVQVQAKLAALSAKLQLGLHWNVGG